MHTVVVVALGVEVYVGLPPVNWFPPAHPVWPAGHVGQFVGGVIPAACCRNRVPALAAADPVPVTVTQEPEGV